MELEAAVFADYNFEVVWDYLYLGRDFCDDSAGEGYGETSGFGYFYFMAFDYCGSWDLFEFPFF